MSDLEQERRVAGGRAVREARLDGGDDAARHAVAVPVGLAAPGPPRVVARMRGANGQPPMELGDATDVVFAEVNSKQKGGTIGKVTGGLIDRTAYYEHALCCAVAPFMHDDTGLYDEVE